ncbi:MAG: hypothetical protein NTW05_16165 [Pseudonocardiales bacterium]|nr:hypothetical protein [Pseudonocardiales bacterium]
MPDGAIRLGADDVGDQPVGVALDDVLTTRDPGPLVRRPRALAYCVVGPVVAPGPTG